MEGILPWSDVQELEFTEEGFLLEHYIPNKGITLLHGKYSTYKTPLTIHMAKAICTGIDLWGLRVNKASPVLYLEVDSPSDVTTRRMKSIGGEAEGLDVAFFHPGPDLVNPRTSERSSFIYETLWKAHREKHYKMVVVDCLRWIHRLKSVDDDTPTIVYGRLSELFNDAVILVVHHDKKTKLLDRGQRATGNELDELSAESFSGSQAWINHATIGIHIQSVGNGSEAVWLKHTKSQAGERQPPLLVKFTDGGATALPPDSTIEDDLISFVKALQGQGMRITELDRRIAAQLGVSLRTARRRRIEILGKESGLNP